MAQMAILHQTGTEPLARDKETVQKHLEWERHMQMAVTEAARIMVDNQVSRILVMEEAERTLTPTGQEEMEDLELLSFGT